MKATVLLIAASLPFLASSQEPAEQVKVVEQKVALLEQRLSAVERELQYVSRAANEAPEAAGMRGRAAKQMAAEKKKFSADEVAKVEAMYTRASRSNSVTESEVILDSIVSLYPNLNRAGCAQLYRAQREKSAERERLLQDCIARFSRCVYGDGVQVGPLAMYLLGDYYQRTGRQKEAARLFTHILRKYPKAIDHRGELLVENLSDRRLSVEEPESISAPR